MTTTARDSILLPHVCGRCCARALAAAVVTIGFCAQPLPALEHSGTLTGSETWYAADNPHVIAAGGVTVSAGDTLTLEDGVRVEFGPSQQLWIYGTLHAVGTPGKGIVFARGGGSSWGAVYVYGASSAATLQHCTIEGAQYGIATDTATGTVDVADCLLRNNGYGIYARGGSLRFVHCQIVHNTSYGIYLQGPVSPVFGANSQQWNDVHSNGSGGGRDLYNGAEDVAAQHVNWGTAVEMEIQERIWDENDDPSLGLVTYAPWSGAAAPPVISAVAPDSGTTSGNTQVAILGSGFSGTASFDGLAATLLYDTPDSLWC